MKHVVPTPQCTVLSCASGNCDGIVCLEWPNFGWRLFRSKDCRIHGEIQLSLKTILE